jgi:NAD(P)-dependent dehydrogenase (short-subunit alcohol dehydrogenase family)
MPDQNSPGPHTYILLFSGANSGIGKEAALQIAKRGGTVHMVCRCVVNYLQHYVITGCENIVVEPGDL